MRKLRNLCLLIIFISFAVLVGIKALLWYYIEQTAKDIQNTLPPGAFNYQSISTSFKGSTSLNNVNLLIDGQNIKIDKIELVSNNILELLILIAKNWGSKIPSELTLKINGINVSVTSFMINKQDVNFLNDPLTIPCGKINKMTAQDYKNMGYEHFIFDLDIDYKKISNTKVKLNIDFNMRNALQASLSFYGNTSILNNTDNVIPEFQIDIKNNTLQEKFYSYCAKQENISLKEYLNNLTLFTKENLDKETVPSLELTLSDEIVSALNEYQKKPNNIYFSTNPKDNITFKELKNMNEQAVIEIVQPKLIINGKNIPIQFEWISPEVFARRTMQNVSKNNAPIIQSDERLLTPINELNAKAFNKKIEIHTSSGRVYKGAFKKVEGDSLRMTIYKSWGTSDLTLKTDTIRLVYILSDF